MWGNGFFWGGAVNFWENSVWWGRMGKEVGLIGGRGVGGEVDGSWVGKYLGFMGYF